MIPLGPYLLHRPIGLGGMGEVWSGHHRDEPVPVAVKLVFQDGTDSGLFRAQVYNEVRAVSALDHPGIVRIFDLGRVTAASAEASKGELVEDTPYMVMELMQGGSLAPEVGHMDWDRFRFVMNWLLGALAHAHAHGVLHRDIKPANVLLGGGGGRVALTDFGLASLVHERDQEEAWVQGTPAYMAPEQIRGRWRDHGPWTDLYSLGAMAFALVTGKRAFGRTADEAQEGHLHQPMPKLAKEGFPPELDGWVRRLMTKRPRERFQRAAEAASALKALPGVAPALVLPRTWKEDMPALPPSLRGPGRGLVGLRTLRLVDRNKERNRLWTELRGAVSKGECRCVVLTGPTGHGKSRLAHWLGTRAHELGVADWIDVRHEPHQGFSEPLASMVLRAIRGVGLKRSELVARLGGDAEEVDVLAQALMPIAGGVQFGSQRERLACFMHFLQRRARVRPLVLWLDDVQWGMEALELAHMLMECSAPILIVATVQDEALDERPDVAQRLSMLRERSGVSTVRIGPLRPAHTRQLAEDLLGLSPGLATEVAQRTGGNPLFAVQLVQDWVQRDLVELSKTGFRLREGVEVVIPDDVHAVWEVRLSQLLDHRPPEEGHSLELAAVLGQIVDRDEWFAACFAADLVPATERVELLVAERLVRVSEGMQWAFVHAMLRESLLRRAREGGRLSRWHASCVAMLGPGRDPLGIERRAQHLLGSGELELALPLLRQGAEHRLKQGDPHAGHSLLDLRREALLQLKVPESDARWGWQGVLRSHLLLLSGSPNQAQELAEKARQVGFATASVDLLLRATRLLGTIVKSSQPDLAERYLVAAIAASNVVEGPVELASARLTLGEVLIRTGRLEKAVEQLDLAAPVFREQGELSEFAKCLSARAYLERQEGDLVASRRWLEKAARAFEKAGNRRGLAGCLNDLGDLDRYGGRLERAEQRLRRARALYLAVGRPTWVPEMNLGMVLIAQERYIEARALLEPLAQHLERKGRWGLLVPSGVGLIPALAGVQDWASFDEWMDKMDPILDRTGMVDEDLAWAAERAASLCQGAGKTKRAGRARALALRQWTALGRDQEVDRLKP